MYRLTEALLRFHLECHEIGLYNEKCVCGDKIHLLLRFHLECHEIGLYNEKYVCGDKIHLLSS